MLSYYYHQRRRSIDRPFNEYLMPSRQRSYSATIDELPAEDEFNFLRKSRIAIADLNAQELNECLQDEQSAYAICQFLLAEVSKLKSKEKHANYCAFISQSELPVFILVLLFMNQKTPDPIKQTLCRKMLRASKEELVAYNRIFDLRATMLETLKKDKAACKAIKSVLEPVSLKQASGMLQLSERLEENFLVVRSAAQQALAEYKIEQSQQKQPSLMRHACNDAGENFMHLLLKRNDVDVYKVFRFLKAIFNASPADSKKNYYVFASALLIKDINGITPLAILELKGGKWLELRSYLVQQLEFLFASLAVYEPETFAAILLPFVDIFNNNKPKNLIVDLINRELYVQAGLIIDLRCQLRTVIADAFLNALEVKLKNAPQTSREKIKNLLLETLGKVLGTVEYKSIVMPDGNKLHFHLAHKLNLNANNNLAPGNSLAQAELVEVTNSLRYWQALHFEPITNIHIWSRVLNVCANRHTADDFAQVFAKFLKQYDRFKFNIDRMDDQNKSPLLSAIAINCKPLVDAVLKLGAKITPSILFSATRFPLCMQSGLFEYVLDCFMQQEGPDNAAKIFASSVDPEGFNLLDNVILASKSLPAMRALIAKGHPVTKQFSDNQENIIMNLIALTYQKDIEPSLALQMFRELLSLKDCNTLLTQTTKVGYDVLSLLILKGFELDIEVKVASKDEDGNEVEKSLNVGIELLELCFKLHAPTNRNYPFRTNLIHLGMLKAPLHLFKRLLELLQSELRPEQLKALLELKNDIGNNPLEQVDHIIETIVPNADDVDRDYTSSFYQIKRQMLIGIGATRSAAPPPPVAAKSKRSGPKA